MAKLTPKNGSNMQAEDTESLGVEAMRYEKGVVPFSTHRYVLVHINGVFHYFREPKRIDIREAMAATKENENWLDHLAAVCHVDAVSDAPLTYDLLENLPFSQAVKCLNLFQTYFKAFTVGDLSDLEREFFVNGTETVNFLDDELDIFEPTQKNVRDALALIQIHPGPEAEIILSTFLFAACSDDLEHYTKGDPAEFFDNLTWAESFNVQWLFQAYLEDVQKKLQG